VKNKFQIITVVFVSLTIFSCIEPFRPEITNNDPGNQLVVEGKVTDETAPFRVRLTRPDNVYNYQNQYNFRPVTDALVNISDIRGNVFPLFYTDNGWYETEDKKLKGIPGNTYSLNITGSDGTQYESSPELMAEVPPIDSVYYEENEQIYYSDKELITEKWLTIYLNTQSSSDETSYFKWEFDETWEFNMPQYIRVVKHKFREDRIVDTAFMTWVNIPSEQLHCWTSETTRSILVKSTGDQRSGEISKFKITSISPRDDRLSIRYSILVRQYALDKELYNYLKTLESLNQTNGGLYDHQPAPVYGNITCCTENNNALGYFLASSVKTKRIFIKNKGISVGTGHSVYSGCGWEYPPLFGDYYFYGNIVEGIPDAGVAVLSRNHYCTDCRERGTSRKPDFW
jgi:hypothetical protein